MSVKDGVCLEIESLPRIVCSGVKGTMEGEKDVVGSGEDLFGREPRVGQQKSYSSMAWPGQCHCLRRPRGTQRHCGCTRCNKKGKPFHSCTLDKQNGY